MTQHVGEADLGVVWEPNAPEAVLGADDLGTTLRLNAHFSDHDQSHVCLQWSGAILSRLEPPNDERRQMHRLYGAGLSQVQWIGEVIESELIADLGRVVAPNVLASLRHWIVPLKECTVEVIARSLTVQRGA